MGRELKRVPLDFDWPIDEVWKGYINPHYEKCLVCDGSGATMAKHRLSDLVSLLMLSGGDAARGVCHPYFYDAPLHRSTRAVCGEDMVELTTALAGRAPSHFGHDSSDGWRAKDKIIKAAGLPEKWGWCKECDGDGVRADKREAYENWESEEPPVGDGYQIWETVSEGSPISPVFATPEELADHMAGTEWGADKGTDYETWLAFIKGPGWAMSGMCIDGEFISGVEGAVRLEKYE
jgi:hypothetical protein